MKLLFSCLIAAGLLTGCKSVIVEHDRYDDYGYGYPDYDPHGHYHEHDAVIVHHGDAPPFVPPGHLPPPGHARLWYFDRPPGHQPPPFPY